MAETDALETLILPKLAELLEQAVERVSASDAMDRLAEVAHLAQDAHRLARTGALLWRDRSEPALGR